MRPEAVRGSQANSQVSFALIGCGGRGTYDAGIVVKDERARITVLCDVFADRTDNARKELGLADATIYKDYEKALASDVDAVIIATPPFEHPRMLEAAVQAKKHVYCEKPMGVDLAGVAAVIAAARKHGSERRISPWASSSATARCTWKRISACRKARSGRFPTRAGSGSRNDPFTRRPYPDPKIEKLRNWFCYRDYSGDFIVEQDCHNFDVLHWFLGELPHQRRRAWAARKVRTAHGDHGSLHA